MRCRDALGLLGLSLLARSVNAYDCRVVERTSTTNSGTAITEDAYRQLSPFLDVNDGVISIVAFDGDHCVQMCCEQPECLVAVFVDSEATCYLKGAGGTKTESHHYADGVTSYELIFREGESKSIAMKPTECNNKKGLAFDFPDGGDLDALALGMSWWYNWSPGILQKDTTAAQALSGCEYIPMLWGTKDFTDERLQSLRDVGQCSHLLGFNEPNFGDQANLTPTEAADKWSTVKTEAGLLGAEIVSPAVNFCGGNCNREDPIQWLDDFFTACGSDKCGVTAIAVHSYTCQVKYLNKHLHSYLKYGLPIWLTEFACADESDLATTAGQASYLEDALLFLELHPSVARYAWFTGRGADGNGVGGANLLSGSGELTELGTIFFNSYKDLQRCADAPSNSAMEAAPTPSPAPPTPFAEIVVPGTVTGGSVDATAEEITNVIIDNLGGTGSYEDVVSMAPGEQNCPDTAAACVKEDLAVSGPLAPFDEGVSVVFRGPMNLYNIVWFQEKDGSLDKASSWTPTTSDNLVFMNNLGGTEGCSGEFTFCGGFSQSYSDETGDGCATEPKQFAGVVGSDEQVNIMTSTECTDGGTCGFYRSTGMEGWKGNGDGTKVMVFEADMPHCGTEGFSECTDNRPAVWALNDKVLRTAQYGCNCRGMGGNGGCGEFDIVEAVIGSEYEDMLFTTVYDFKGTGSPGTNKYFRRPTAPAHFAAIFRGGDNAYLQVVQLTDFDYTQDALSATFLDSLKAAASEVHSVYNVDA